MPRKKILTYKKHYIPGLGYKKKTQRLNVVASPVAAVQTLSDGYSSPDMTTHSCPTERMQITTSLGEVAQNSCSQLESSFTVSTSLPTERLNIVASPVAAVQTLSDGYSSADMTTHSCPTERMQITTSLSEVAQDGCSQLESSFTVSTSLPTERESSNALHDAGNQSAQDGGSITETPRSSLLGFSSLSPIKHLDISSTPDFTQQENFNCKLMSNNNSIVCHQQLLDSLYKISGNYIVDLKHVLKQFVGVIAHTCVSAHGQFCYSSSRRAGIISFLTFKCSGCGAIRTISTSECLTTKSASPTRKLSLNDLAVWGFSSIGGGYSNLDEVFSVLGIHPMTEKTFLNHEKTVLQAYDELTLEQLLIAGKEERKLALECGDVTPDGTVFIRVIVDATFSKRSYGHNYTAKSACGVIIGARTKKLLFVGIRNKYCCVCASDSNKGVEIRTHTCYRNWDGPTTAMEADIILEGFMKSESMHNMQYRCIIGDGDSSVYNKIQECVPYGRYVQKIECTNHVVKNFTKRLYKLQGLSKDCLRNLPSYKINRLKRGVRGAIIHTAKELAKSLKTHSGNARDIYWRYTKELKADLANVPHHAYNKHDRCKEYFCSKSKAPEEFSKLSTVLQAGIFSALQPVIDMASSILENQTSNLAEYCMSLIAKTVGGKQINRSQKGIYETRSKIASMQYQKGRHHHYLAMKKFTQSSPASPIKAHATRVMRKVGTARKCLLIKMNAALGVKENRGCLKTKQSASKKLVNIHYGPQAQRPDATSEELAYREEEKLKLLQVTEEKQKDIERSTVDQVDNPAWFIQRQHRLTASHFGAVCVKRAATSCENLVKRILYPKDIQHLDSIRYGKENESIAISAFEKKTGNVVSKCGLFVDLKYGFLGASPDGLVDKDATVEVKCPHSLRDFTINEAIESGKQFFLVKTKQDVVTLKKSHEYFYQVQGQLHITGRKLCYFIVFTQKDIHVETITYNHEFWKKMENRLVCFFKQCLLPEIVDSRYLRSLPIRNPPSVLEAQEQKAACNKAKELTLPNT